MENVLLALLNIIIIDLVLSGDNAVVIGMAVHRLPPRQKRQAVLVGGGLALLLRLLLTSVAAFLLEIPLLQALGALVLVWITYRLLTENDGAGTRVQNVDAGFVAAMRTIIIADVTMSLDNVLAVGAAAHGDIVLLIFGLGLSMAILIAGGTLVSLLISKLGWLNYVGAAVLVVLSGQMLADDSWLHGHNIIPTPAEAPLLPWVFSAVIGVALLALLLWRRSRGQNGSANASGHDTSSHSGARGSAA